jgi:hypothetical protein
MKRQAQRTAKRSSCRQPLQSRHSLLAAIDPTKTGKDNSGSKQDFFKSNQQAATS